MSRTSSVIGWICTGLVSALTIFSAIMEFIPVTDPAMIAYVEKMGVGPIAIQLAITKFIISALYLWPRTSTVGFVLMVGYYGGALATNITHGFTFGEYFMILIVLALLTLDAYLRKPELLYRLKGKQL
jgi:hypothetical protein